MRRTLSNGVSLQEIALLGRRALRYTQGPEPVEGFDGLTMFLFLRRALDYTFRAHTAYVLRLTC